MVLLSQINKWVMVIPFAVLLYVSFTFSNGTPSKAHQVQVINIEYPKQPDLKRYVGQKYSQIAQDVLVANILKNQTGGFFVESGGYDGVKFSNTLS